MRYIKLYEDFSESSIIKEIKMIFSDFTDVDGELIINVVDNMICLGLVAKDTSGKKDSGFSVKEREALLSGFARMDSFCEDHGYHLITDGVDGSYVELVEEKEMCPSCGLNNLTTDYNYERGRTYYECNDCGEEGGQDDFVNRHLDIKDENGSDIESLISMGLISIYVNYSN